MCVRDVLRSLLLRHCLDGTATIVRGHTLAAFTTAIHVRLRRCPPETTHPAPKELHVLVLAATLDLPRTHATHKARTRFYIGWLVRPCEVELLSPLVLLLWPLHRKRNYRKANTSHSNSSSILFSLIIIMIISLIMIMNNGLI